MPFSFRRAYGSTSGTSASITLNAGDVSIISVMWQGASISISSITDTLGNTWTAIPGTFQASNGLGIVFGDATAYVQLFRCLVTTGGSATVTVTFSGSAISPSIQGFEFIPPAGTPVVDQATGQTGNSNPVTPSITTTSADEAIVAVFLANNVNGSAGSGWTSDVANGFVLTEYRIASSTGTFTGDQTSPGSGLYCAAIASIKIASVATAKPTVCIMQ